MSARTDIHPRTIDIPQSDIDDLHDRLRRTRRQAAFPEDTWQRGVPQAELDRLVDAWLEHDWRATEARLNCLGQLTTEIDGQTIHAMHVRSPHADATPIILMHGWPSSFLEHVDLIERLTRPELHGGAAADAFHVISPSLPGFGLSTPLDERTDASPAGMAAMMLELMTRLGYDMFVAEGSDVGSSVAPEMGRLAPSRVIGVYVAGTIGAFVDAAHADALGELTEVEQGRVARVGTYMQRELGYIAIQSTRPGLVGAMLADSPVALLAWMVDKLQAWTWPEDVPADEALGLEFVLANASLWWFTASAGSAADAGYARAGGWGERPGPSGVPTGAIQFAHDVGIRASAEREHAIVRWTDVTDRGGHFAALEQPETLIGDLRSFVRELR